MSKWVRRYCDLISDLKKIFDKSDYEPDEISGIFTGSTNSLFGNLVKSDLDADRIDYGNYIQ